MALKSSCYDLNTVTFSVSETSETLLTHLKKQMEQEKENIGCKFPLTFYVSVVMESVRPICQLFLKIFAKSGLKIIWFLSTVSQRPLTNYYQYSLGVLALCASGVRVNNHVSNKLIKAVEHEHFKHGNSESIGE